MKLKMHRLFSSQSLIGLLLSSCATEAAIIRLRYAT